MRSKKKIIIFQHAPEEGPGHIPQILPRLDITFEIFHSYSGLPFPPSRDFDGAISLGGYMGAHDEADHPWISLEIQWLKEALSSRKKIFGICLGAQLLSRALGGRVEKNPIAEIGWHPVRWKGKGTRFSSVGCQELPNSVMFQWHQDTFIPPASPALEWLAESEACPQQAFAWSDLALGVQFHPEINASELHTWISHPEGRANILEKLELHGPTFVTHPDVLLQSPAITYERSQLVLEKLLRWLWR